MALVAIDDGALYERANALMLRTNGRPLSAYSESVQRDFLTRLSQVEIPGLSGRKRSLEGEVLDLPVLGSNHKLNRRKKSLSDRYWDGDKMA
jgi:hypothetical protein